MTLVLVEVANEAAVQSLRLQQGVRVVGVIAEPPAVETQPEQPTPRKWAGALAAIATTSAEEWDKYLREIRNEWERDI